MPREPEVLGNPTRPWSVSTSPTASATRRTQSHGTSGWGSRSTRSSSGRSRSARRTGHGLKSMTPRLTAHARCAASLGHSSVAVRPLGKLTVAVWSHSGAPLGHALLEERLRRRPVDVALHHRRPLTQVDERGIGHRQVVLDELELGDPDLGEEHLVGVREAHLAPGHLEHQVRRWPSDPYAAQRSARRPRIAR